MDVQKDTKLNLEPTIVSGVPGREEQKNEATNNTKAATANTAIYKGYLIAVIRTGRKTKIYGKFSLLFRQSPRSNGPDDRWLGWMISIKWVGSIERKSIVLS